MIVDLGIIEMGHSAIIAALILSGVGGLVSLYLLKHPPVLALRFSQGTGLFILGFLILSIMALGYAFISSDFALKTVVMNSEAAQPLIYRFVALWGNHEGSMLLWVVTMAVYSAVFSFTGAQTISIKDRVRMQALLSFILFGFLVFIFATSNPFERLDVIPKQGLGLNPILQDPSMTFHPPTLYFGYIGFVIPFVIAVGLLWSSTFTRDHAIFLRQWTLIPWIFLTLGILTGSFWAYYELGWGGWWFWDPVENASLLPWLAATALLHALAVFRKKGTKSGTGGLWSLFLALLTFILSLLGTYVVRSGSLMSVHSFAQDAERGLFLLAFLALVGGLSMGLFIFRLKKIRGKGVAEKGLMAWISRSGLITVNTYLFIVSIVIVLLGTFYPLFIGGDVSIGASFFNQSLMPLALIALVLMGLVPFLPWQHTINPKTLRNPEIFKKNLLILNIVLLLTVYLLYRQEIRSILAILSLSFSVGVILMTGKGWLLKENRTAKTHGMFLAHMGFAVCILGMSVDSLFDQEKNLLLSIGETKAFQDYTFTLDTIETTHTPTYDAEIATLSVKQHDTIIAYLKPEKRLYRKQAALLTETAIHQTPLFSQLYVVLGPLHANGKRSIRVLYHPFVLLIWLGALLMALGGFISLRPFRSFPWFNK